MHKVNGFYYATPEELEKIDTENETRLILPVKYYEKKFLRYGKPYKMLFDHNKTKNREQIRKAEKYHFRKNSKGFPVGYNAKSWGEFCTKE